MATYPDKKEFLKLIQDNQGIIFRVCNSYCYHKTDQEDLAQEIIYQLWKSGYRFDPAYRFTTWMYRIALNVAISFYRRALKNTGMIFLTDNLAEMEDKIDDADFTEEDVNQLQRFIHGLKELDRALMLLYLEEKSYAEIAEILGISETNTATRINRIKGKLKEKFSELPNHKM